MFQFVAVQEQKMQKKLIRQFPPTSARSATQPVFITLLMPGDANVGLQLGFELASRRELGEN